MILLFYVLVFVVFLPIGSFIGVVVDRVIRNESFLNGRSYCESCKHKLSILDLIPIFSYIVLKGKCKYCNVKIPTSVFISEIVVGASSAMILARPVFMVAMTGDLSYLYQLLFLTILLLGLQLVFLSDLKYQLIPDVYIVLLIINFVFFAAISIIFNINIFLGYVHLFVSIYDHLLGAFLMIIFFALMYFLSKKRAMGEGDIFLGGILGLYAGAKYTLIMWFISFLTGSVVSIVLMLLRNKGLRDKIPFGPFLIIGFLAAVFYGPWFESMYFTWIVFIIDLIVN